MATEIKKDDREHLLLSYSWNWWTTSLHRASSKSPGSKFRELGTPEIINAECYIFTNLGKSQL